MRISKLWPGFVVGLTLLVAACGGGGSTSVTPAATATPTTAPTATPSPGPLQVAYTTSYGVSVAATTAPTALAFQAETQTATLTATQANYSGSYAAALSAGCGANVSLSAATSTTGSFTLTAVGPVASTANCSVSITGATGTTAVALGATVPAPGGVQLSWIANAALAQATATNPAQPVPGPINLIGTTSLFQAILVVSENAYVSTFNAPTLSAGCGTNISALTTFTPTATNPIVGAPSGTTQARAYYVVVAPSTATFISSASNCSVTVTDKQTTPSSASIGITLTTTGGGIN